MIERAMAVGTFATVLAIGACSKTSSESAPPVLSAAPSASARAARAAPSASAGEAAMEQTVWAGSYTAKVGAVEPPKNANEKTWTQDPGSAAIGKGTVDLSIHGHGEAQGEAKGALGDLAISGVYDGKELRANLVPKDPKADGAMTGFMLLATEGDALKGSIRVSSRDARIVREAAVDLAKK